MRLFARPLPLLATAALALNDHVLKGRHVLPEAVTGKLSDVAGLFVVPVLAAGIAGQLGARGRTRTTVAAWGALAAGIVFTLVKTSPAACAWLTAHGFPTVCDSSDLLALPALVAAWAYVSRHARSETSPNEGRGREIAERVGLVFAAIASLATSPAPRPFTAWQVREGKGEGRTVGCARVDVWVAKSGKEGAGFFVGADAQSTCDVEVSHADLTIAGHTYAPAELSREPVHPGGKAYLPFLFDNERLWNENQREGTLHLEIVAGGERFELVLPLAHVWTNDRSGPLGVPPAPRPVPAPLPLAVPPETARTGVVMGQRVRLDPPNAESRARSGGRSPTKGAASRAETARLPRVYTCGHARHRDRRHRDGRRRRLARVPRRPRGHPRAQRLAQALDAPEVTHVLSVSRKPTAHTHPKLEQLLVPDFRNLDEAALAKLGGYDACFYCAGISSAGVSEADYTVVTYDTPVAFAEALARLSPNLVLTHVSGAGTDGTERGRIMWARVKGRAENALMRLPFKGVYNFRPGIMTLPSRRADGAEKSTLLPSVRRPVSWVRSARSPSTSSVVRP